MCIRYADKSSFAHLRRRIGHCVGGGEIVMLMPRRTEILTEKYEENIEWNVRSYVPTYIVVLESFVLCSMTVALGES